MQPTHLAAFLEFSRTVVAMCAAFVALFGIGMIAAKDDIARSRGLDKVVALTNLCFALPLAVFSMEHFCDASSLMKLVPSYMPWPLFWTYLVGVGLISASLSIATKIQVRWSGLLFGIMMFSFVVMMDIPGAVANGGRISWTLALREMAFGGGGWVLAGTAMSGERGTGKGFIAVGRVLIGMAAVFYGVQHFLHPLGMPGVPLEKQMPAWIPARVFIDYATGLSLIVAGICFLLARKTRLAATYLGAWILFLVVIIYGPVMMAALANPSTDVKVEGINYFTDTLLFVGVILALARAAVSTPASSNVSTVVGATPSRLGYS